MQEVLQYFPDITEHQKEQFSQLKDLYKDWNLKINVVSRRDIDEIYLRHVLHSLGIAKVQAFHPGSKVLDGEINSNSSLRIIRDGAITVFLFLP